MKLVESWSNRTVLRTVAGLKGSHGSNFFYIWPENRSQSINNLNIKKKKNKKKKQKKKKKTNCEKEEENRELSW